MRHSRFVMALCSSLLLVPQLVLAEGGATPRYSPQPVLPVSSTPTPAAKAPGRYINPINTPLPLKVPVASPLPAEFCTNLTAVNSTIGDTTATRFSQLTSSYSQEASQIKTNLSDLNQKLAGARAAADSKRKQDFTGLSAKATTPAQQQAIATFEATVNQAINTERAAIDAANQTYEQGLQSALSGRKATITAAATTYKTAVANALAAAKASCESGAAPSTVRTTLQSALQAARAAFNTAIQNAQSSSPDLSTLQQARQAAVTAADTAFKATVQQALATLKAALGVTAGPTPSPTP